jgi:hypothetical protein
MAKQGRFTGPRAPVQEEDGWLSRVHAAKPETLGSAPDPHDFHRRDATGYNATVHIREGTGIRATGHRKQQSRA